MYHCAILRYAAHLLEKGLLVQHGLGGSIRKLLTSLVVCGAAIAGVAVVLDVWARVRPPHAYGYCVSCHGRDLVAWLVNHLLHVQWEISEPGRYGPIVTVAGLLLGAFLASALTGERRAQRATVAWRSLAAGALAAILALVALGCPVHQALLLGYGDWLAIPALAAFYGGASLGTMALGRWAERRQ